MKRIRIITCILAVLFCFVTFISAVGKSDVEIIGVKTSTTTAEKKVAGYTAKVVKTIDAIEQGQYIDIKLELVATKDQSPPNTGDWGNKTLAVVMIFVVCSLLITATGRKFNKALLVLVLTLSFLPTVVKLSALPTDPVYVITEEFDSKIMRGFSFDSFIGRAPGTAITNKNGQNQDIGITWTVDAKEGTQTLVYRLSLIDTVPDGILGSEIPVSTGNFEIIDSHGVKTTTDIKAVSIWMNDIGISIVMKSLKYEPNGAIGSPVQISTPQGSTMLVASNTGFSNGNARFLNWNTSPNGQGETFTPGQGITMNKDYVLYAQWEEPVKATITYNWNRSDNPQPSITDLVVMGSDYRLKDNPWRDASGAYLLMYWNTMPDGSGVNLAPGLVIQCPGNLTLYAIWGLVM